MAFLILLGVAGLSSCALTPPGPSSAQGQAYAALNTLLDDQQVRDARFQRIAGHDFLAVDYALRYRIDQYPAGSGVAQRQRFVAGFIEDARQIDGRAMGLYLQRLPDDMLTAWRRERLPGIDGNDGILPAYESEATLSVGRELRRLQSLDSGEDVDAYWQALTGNIEESIMTRGRVARQLLTAPAVPFVKGWIAYHEATDPRGPTTLRFENYELYSLAPAGNPPAGVSAADWDLLRHHAPNIVHELNPRAAYAKADDRFGRISLSGSQLQDAMPQVDTRRPALYAYVDRKQIQGAEVRQLVYTLWHPSHPQLSRFDPEAGILDGWTIRITLDSQGQPTDYESVSNCGCYYKNFPTDRLESRARAAYARPLKGKQFHIENIADGVYDAVVPELVKDIDGRAPNDTWLYFSAGHHQLITIRSARHAMPVSSTAARYQYDLLPYETLESLPFNGYRASLFDSDGLVRQAHRSECKLLTPSGLFHAGHARQRETQMIYFDEAVFDAPDLLETYLRLPPNAFGEKT